MATDFAVFLRRFLTAHLAGLRGCSPSTVASYRDTFKLLIVFFRDGKSIPPEKLGAGCWSARRARGCPCGCRGSGLARVAGRRPSLLELADVIRREMEDTLASGTVSPARLAHVEEIIASHVRLHTTTPPAAALGTRRGGMRSRERGRRDRGRVLAGGAAI